MAHSENVSQIPDDQLGFIYMITNTVTQLSYVGSTMRSVSIRCQEHFQNAADGSDTQFYRAIRKYGIDKWVVNTIEENIPEYQLRQREGFWIDYHNTFFNGYNSKREGRGAYSGLKHYPHHGGYQRNFKNISRVEGLVDSIVDKWKSHS